jgi:hypothetical protein
MNRRAALKTALGAGVALCAHAQGGPRIVMGDAPLLHFPGVDVPERDLHHECDSNSPVHWDGNTVYVFNSYNHPVRSSGPDLFHLVRGSRPKLGALNDQLSLWIESTWKDDDAVLYGAYHYEPDLVCFSNRHLPTMPRVGWLRSEDNGENWDDLGFIIEAKRCAIKCDTASPWDAGGAGDFVFLPDENRRYFYFFGTSYDPDPAQQGIFAARLPYADRNDPAGKVVKWANGSWSEPGVWGRITPVFPSQRDYHRADGTMFWGPAFHFNTYLGMYVMLLNHAIDTRLNTDGIYASFSDSLEDPRSWSKPEMVLDVAGIRQIMQGAGVSETKMASGWYPQAIGTARGETDKRLGRTGRFFLAGLSKKTITFLKPGESQ